MVGELVDFSHGHFLESLEWLFQFVVLWAVYLGGNLLDVPLVMLKLILVVLG